MTLYHSYFLFICLAILMTFSLWQWSTYTLVIQHKTLSTSRPRYIFLSKIFSWMREGGSKAITIKTALVLLHSTCPVLEISMHSAVCARNLSSPINMSVQLVANNSLQVPLDLFCRTKCQKRSCSECFGGGEIVLVKHYWHGLTHISSIQGEESQFSFGKKSRKVKGWGWGSL